MPSLRYIIQKSGLNYDLHLVVYELSTAGGNIFRGHRAWVCRAHLPRCADAQPRRGAEGENRYAPKRMKSSGAGYLSFLGWTEQRVSFVVGPRGEVPNYRDPVFVLFSPGVDRSIYARVGSFFVGPRVLSFFFGSWYISRRWDRW